MWATLIAVLGTLAGAALASSTQILADRRARAAQQRDVITAAVGDLLRAVLAYRERYWLMIAGLRKSRSQTYEELAALYNARSAVTGAFDHLALVTPDQDLFAAADEAAWAAIELANIEVDGPDSEGRFSPATEAALDAGRERSRDAHTALRRAATAHIHPRWPANRRRRG
ncbi:hypothetical protein [Streptomyces sp. NPDC057617]|uniref:hypothetical protein n=1 Tax=Streptomyces sp. NPDC057617 TaxID=3346184 RepID=UPI0036926CC7